MCTQIASEVRRNAMEEAAKEAVKEPEEEAVEEPVKEAVEDRHIILGPFGPTITDWLTLLFKFASII